MAAQLCRARPVSINNAHYIIVRSSRTVLCRAKVKRSQQQQQQQPSQQQEASTSAATDAPVEPSVPVVREFRALGSKVVESNVDFKGPEDQPDFWEGAQFEAFGKALENYFIPGLIALGLLCGGIAAKSYNEGATTFVKPPTGPDAEPSIIIATPEALATAPSISE